MARGGCKALRDADLFFPPSGSKDRPHFREAGLLDDVTYQPTGRLGREPIDRAVGNGIVRDGRTFDERYGGRRSGPGRTRRPSGAGWARPPVVPLPDGAAPGPDAPQGWDGRAGGPRARDRPAFRDQTWRRVTWKRQTRCEPVWQAKAAAVYRIRDGETTAEVKDLVSNAPSDTPLERLRGASPSRAGTGNTDSAWPKVRSVLAIPRGPTTPGGCVPGCGAGWCWPWWPVRRIDGGG